MTVNGVIAVTLRYFTEFGKPALQKTICGRIYARVCNSPYFAFFADFDFFAGQIRRSG